VIEHPVIETPEAAAPLPGTAELRFEFSEDCWLEVTDADDRKLAYRLYRAGDVTRLRGKAPMAVFLGNSEGVRLTVDGAPIAVRPASRRDGTARLTVGGGAG
jgi:cytoskeleton protein RodZ